MRKTLSILEFIPSVWPVVQRELRARARKPRYYWMRILGGVFAMFILYSILKSDFSTVSEAAISAFISLEVLVIGLILIAVPAMTSDCVAREKREGTLGLLFLTPLSPAGIIIGKSVTQVLLAWSIWLSILPAMAIPFLLGGITWRSLVAAAVFQLCAVVISLAAGLLASCLTQKRNLSLFCSAILTGYFGSLLALLISAIGAPPAQRSLIRSIEVGCELALTMQLPLARVTAPWIQILIGTSCLALAILIAAIYIAARHIRKTWGDNPPTARHQWWTKLLCTELFRMSFRRKMQHSLDRNPIAWLQQYSWKARITKWGVCLLFLIVLTYGAQDRSPGAMVNAHLFLLVTLVAVGTIAGVGSFRSEKESGALELILITPLSVKQIILGRVIGWWKQFLPAAILFLLLAITHAAFDQSPTSSWTRARDARLIELISWIDAVVFFCLPFFSVYAALRVKNFLVAVLLTWIALIVVFAFGASIATLFGARVDINHQAAQIFYTLLSAIAFVRLTFFLLRHSLSRRIYSF